MFFRDFFEEKGLKVSINFPYTGKYILGHHCHRRRIPPFLVPGIQIELNQGLYMQGDTHEKNPAKIAEYRAMFDELVDAYMQKFCPEELAE